MGIVECRRGKKLDMEVRLEMVLTARAMILTPCLPELLIHEPLKLLVANLDDTVIDQYHCCFPCSQVTQVPLLLLHILMWKPPLQIGPDILAPLVEGRAIANPYPRKESVMKQRRDVPMFHCISLGVGRSHADARVE